MKTRTKILNSSNGKANKTRKAERVKKLKSLRKVVSKEKNAKTRNIKLLSRSSKSFKKKGGKTVIVDANSCPATKACPDGCSDNACPDNDSNLSRQ